MFTLTDNTDNARHDDVCCSANQAGRKVRQFLDTATHETRDATAAVEKQIRRNPLAASAIAAGIGFLAAAFFRRR